MKVKSPGKGERYFIVGREKEHGLLDSSQASPARPSDESRVKVNALGWLEAVAWERGRGTLISDLVSTYNLEENTFSGFDSKGA
jgi:hypothetical protein